MKLRHLSVSLISTLLLVGCAKEASTTAGTGTTPSATAPSAAAATTPTSTAAPASAAPQSSQAAAGRVVEITANDQMQFSVKTIEATAGEQLTVSMTNVGMLPKDVMGHNWVLLKAGVDAATFAVPSGVPSAKATNYIADSVKDQVIAFIPVLGPKEKQQVTFTVPGPGEYVYLCSFPGHFALMQGKLIVK